MRFSLGMRFSYRNFQAAVLVVTISLYLDCSKADNQMEEGGGKGKRDLGEAAGEISATDMPERVKSMFYHGFGNYIRHAFPHDELKPLSAGYTDSLAELGNLNLENLSSHYKGVALTLVDSLSTLAVLGDAETFSAGVLWLEGNLSFDQDVRVNIFEANIRLLGGLLSAHLLASDDRLSLMPDYEGGLLPLAEDLARRLLPAFSASPTGLPYAWVNLRHGVREGETAETNTAACGSLILEMGMLSRLTGQPIYERVARRAVLALWAMRSGHDLLGAALNMSDASWIGTSGGIGAGSDSFYEYMLKAYILFGDEEYYTIFQRAYLAAIQSYRSGPWYHDADIRTAQPTHLQFTSLQAFWPGLQVLVGDLSFAKDTFRSFFSVWERFGLLPERFQWDTMELHPTERYYPLRPELIESAYHLYAATGDTAYRDAGRRMAKAINRYAKVGSGYASIRSVATMEREDHMHSFFLAETCKYLYLLFNDTFLQGGDYIFTTEGHLFPVHRARSRPLWPSTGTAAHALSDGHGSRRSALESRVCPNPSGKHPRSSCFVPDRHIDHRHGPALNHCSCPPLLCFSPRSNAGTSYLP